MTLRRTLTTLLLLLLALRASAQGVYPPQPTLDAGSESLSAELPTNSVSHMDVEGGVLWIGTGRGLARSADGGGTWQTYQSVPQFARPGIYAVVVRGDSIWTSTGYTKDVDGQNVQTGSGYTFSLDGGLSWNAVDQPLDAAGDSLVQYGLNTVRFVPIVVREQNVTFDVALSSGTVWVASWAAGIRKSTDRGATWQRTVLPSRGKDSISPLDTLGSYKIDPRLDNNYLGFSVFAESDSVIWAGTAGGINKSTDGGLSWRKFRSDNQTFPILGDWVIAIKAQRWNGRTRMWATSWPAEGASQQYGVCASEDGGSSWRGMLHGVKAYDFAFRDSITYVATEEGIFRSTDGGDTWLQSGSIVDTATGERITTRTFYCLGVLGDTLFAGGSDGVVKTADTPAKPFGSRWQVLRTASAVPDEQSAYAYPNPFSPRFDVTRIRYRTAGTPVQVTLEIFDFGMNRVRTVVHDAPRSGAVEYDEIWDGRDDGGAAVPNGVYFYRVVKGDGDPAWGKIMVLQ